MAPTTGQANHPSTWSILATIFIALFIIVSFGSVVVLGFYHHQKQQSRTMSLDPFEVSAIEALEAQLSVQQAYNAEADHMIELLERTQKQLETELRDERRRMEPVDPDVFQRIYDEIHMPMSPPRPSLPPLVVNSTDSTSALRSTPVTPIVRAPTQILPQTTKLHGIMRTNSRSSPERTIHVVQPPAVARFPTGSSVTVEYESNSYNDEYYPPTVGEKPQDFAPR
ncbi:unnamed protein product [Discula destructiva]